MKPSSVTDYLVDNLSFRAERQKVISGNIANINTPNYKAKDVVFAQELEKTNQLELARTNKNHFAINGAGETQKYSIIQKKSEIEQNDGNNVSMDEEVSEMSKNNTAFEAIQSSIKKDSMWFKLMLDSSGKL